jgi:DNA polymerase-3 subunit delta
VNGGGFAEWVKRPPKGLRLALFYGGDAGLIAESADLLARSVCADLRDPFQVADLTAATVDADPARLVDEVAALSLMGGRRVVRLRGAGAKHADLLEPLLVDAVGDTMVIVEAPDVTSTKLKLVTLFEKSAGAVAVSCFADGAETLRPVIQAMLREAGLEAAREVIDRLTDRLGGDRLLSRREIEKLILYVGDGAREVTVADVDACVGDNSELRLDDLVFAVGGGDIAGLDRDLARCYAAGEVPVAVLRAVQRHFQRLQLASAGTRPPGIFFKRAGEFDGQAQNWPAQHLARALDLLTDAEVDCKTTGMPAEAVCRHALLRIAQVARAGRR